MTRTTKYHPAPTERGDERVFSAQEKTAGAVKGKRALTNEEVRMWREQYRAGKITNKEIREITGLAAESVARMLRGDTYRNVDDAPPVEMPKAERDAQIERLMEVQRKAEERKAKGESTASAAVGERLKENKVELTPKLRERLGGFGFKLPEEGAAPAGTGEEEKTQEAKDAEAKSMLGELTQSAEPTPEELLRDLQDLYGDEDGGGKKD